MDRAEKPHRTRFAALFVVRVSVLKFGSVAVAAIIGLRQMKSAETATKGKDRMAYKRPNAFARLAACLLMALRWGAVGNYVWENYYRSEAQGIRQRLYGRKRVRGAREDLLTPLLGEQLRKELQAATTRAA